MTLKNLAVVVTFQNYLLLTITALLFCLTVTVASAGDPMCPTYKDGQFWIFKAKEVNGMVSKSNLLDGEYKVIYKKDHVDVEGYPYPDNYLLLLFQCADGAGLVRTDLSEGMNWPNEYSVRSAGIDVVVKTTTKVVGVTTLPSGDQVFRLHRNSKIMARTPFDSEVDYLFSPRLSVVVDYDLNTKDRPFTLKMSLIGVGSEDSGEIQFVDITGKVDEATKQRVLALYGRKK